jgi:phytoene dehydrogenase-like protein
VEGEVPSLYLSFPGLKDPKASKPTAEIIAPVSYGLFEKWKGKPWMDRGKEYELLKGKISETLLATVEKHLPGFREQVAYYELSTPLTVENFTGHREGNIYGFPASPRRFDLAMAPARKPLKGLALVGADAGSLGIVGAMMGGVAGVASRHGYGIFPKVFRGSPKS